MAQHPQLDKGDSLNQVNFLAYLSGPKLRVTYGDGVLTGNNLTQYRASQVKGGI
jgi:hypothetical protein